jgi:sialate O-acetylesterase
MLARTLLATVAVAMASASFRMHKVVSSHMVLQAEKPSIFGFGDAGASITATLGSEKKTATVSADGKWLISLSPREASISPTNISVSDGKATIVLSDVLFGDVWVCRFARLGNL